MASKLDYLYQCHAIVIEDIKLADQKATVLIPLNSAILGALYGADLLILDFAKIFWSLATAVAFSVLIAGTLLSIFVISPRGKYLAVKFPGAELVNFRSITAKFKNPEEYAAAIHTADTIKLEDNMARLIYIRSILSRTKFDWLIRALTVSAAGWLLAGLLIMAKLAGFLIVAKSAV
jgi:hypothetical protein